MRPMFRLPEAPPYLAGLIDVRGRSVPVIDLRVKLGLPATTATETTRILVLEIVIDGRSLALGLIADRVFEVMALDVRQVEAPPDIGVKWRSDYISGVGRRAGGFVIIFDLAPPVLDCRRDAHRLQGHGESAQLHQGRSLAEPLSRT